MSATVIIVIVLALAAFGFRQSKRAGSTGSEPAPDQVTLLMLGFQGSGKTLMLASLFKHFRLGGPYGITLLTDDVSERELEQLIDKIQDTSNNDLPDSTGLGDTRAWRFTVRVLGEDGNTADALTLKYLDYAGEYAESVSGAGTGEVDGEFLSTLKSADIIVGVLDGEKIRRLLVDGGQGRVAHELDRLLRLLVRADQRSVHLVISKWDRLKDAHGRPFTLDQVVRQLEEKSAGFRDFRRTPKFGRIRIIPVSTFGRDFIDVLPDGSTAKRPGAQWRPMNIDLPFYCTLPDILSGDIALMAANAKPGSTTQTTVSRDRLAQVTLGALAMADIALKISTHGFALTVPFSAITARVRARLAAPQEHRQPAVFGTRDALGRVLKASYSRSEAFDKDPSWKIHPPVEAGQP